MRLLILLLAAALSVQAEEVKEVKVVNKVTQPVPVQGSVTVTSLPAVTLAGTPTVQLAGLPPLQFPANASVQVSNTVKTSDGGQPFVAGVHLSVTAGQTSAISHWTVPQGKRAVIEFVSASGTGGPDSALYLLPSVTPQLGTGNGYFYVPMQQQPIGMNGSMLVKLYADPGSDVGVIVYAAPNSDFNCTVHGLLFDL